MVYVAIHNLLEDKSNGTDCPGNSRDMASLLRVKEEKTAVIISPGKVFVNDAFIRGKDTFKIQTITALPPLAASSNTAWHGPSEAKTAHAQQSAPRCVQAVGKHKDREV